MDQIPREPFQNPKVLQRLKAALGVNQIGCVIRSRSNMQPFSFTVNSASGLVGVYRLTVPYSGFDILYSYTRSSPARSYKIRKGALTKRALKNVVKKLCQPFIRDQLVFT